MSANSTTVATPAKPKKQSERMRRAKKLFNEWWEMYLFLVPGVIYIIIFDFIPIFMGYQLPFKEYSHKLGIIGSPWVGFMHFEKFLDSFQFARVFWNTVRISIIGSILSYPFPIMFALCLNSMITPRYKKVVQTITYMPHFISVVIMVGILKQFFHPRVGAVGAVYTMITGQTMRDLFGIPAAFDWLYIGSGIWQGFGWGSILYLAALSGVSPELHEAATVDGASRFQRVIHIDIPAITPTIVILLIMDIGGLVGVGMNKILLMQNDLNLKVSEVISTYVYKRGLGSGGASDYAYSAAVGLFNTMINLVLLYGANTLSRKVSDYALW